MNTAVAALVILKVDFTIFTHYCGFGGLAPYLSELPVVLEEESSEDLHVESDYGPSIPDASAPAVQQLGGVYGSFSSVRRHLQVTLVSAGGLTGSMTRHGSLS